MYLPGLMPQAGSPVSVPDPSDGVTPNKLAAIPAIQLVDGSTGAASPTGSSTSPTYTQSAALPAGTDRSGTTSATTGTATQLAAANTARRGLNIQNISTGNIGINEIGGTAAIGTAGTYTIAAGASFNVRTNRAISVVGAAASLPYTATEF
jgi:hypothetical protein